MQLIFRILKSNIKGKNAIEIILKNKQTYKERVDSGNEVLKGIDKILNKSKIKDIKKISKIKIDNLSKNRYTTYRVVKSIEKALKFNLS